MGARETLCLSVQLTTVITVDSTWLGEGGGGVRGVDGREERGGRGKERGGKGREREGEGRERRRSEGDGRGREGRGGERERGEGR